MELIELGKENVGRTEFEKTKTTLCLWCNFIAGDNAVETNQGLHLIYMHAGTNPFEVVYQAVKYVSPFQCIENLLISCKYLNASYHLFDLLGVLSVNIK